VGGLKNLIHELPLSYQVHTTLKELSVIGMGITTVEAKKEFKISLQYKYDGMTNLSEKPKNKEDQAVGHLHYQYLPIINAQKIQHFENWVAEEIVNDWRDMNGWEFEYQTTSNFDGQLQEVDAEKINYMFFFKIVYSVPKVPLVFDEKESKKEIGPIAFRLTYAEDKKKRTPIQGCMTIGKTLGEKRSVFHFCTITDVPNSFKV